MDMGKFDDEFSHNMNELHKVIFGTGIDGLQVPEKFKDMHSAIFGDPEVSKEIEELENIVQFTNILGEMAELYSKKNSDYGGAFDESLDEDGLLVLKIRLMDKIRRFNTLIKNEALVKDESIEDTLMDLANYAVMGLKWIRSTK